MRRAFFFIIAFFLSHFAYATAYICVRILCVVYIYSKFWSEILADRGDWSVETKRDIWERGSWPNYVPTYMYVFSREKNLNEIDLVYFR